jgi:hypothetical protein
LDFTFSAQRLALAVGLESQLTKWRKLFVQNQLQKRGPLPNPLHAVLGTFHSELFSMLSMYFLYCSALSATAFAHSSGESGLSISKTSSFGISTDLF